MSNLLLFTLNTNILKGSIVFLKELNIHTVVKNITIDNEGYKIEFYNTPNLPKFLNVGGSIDEIMKIMEVRPTLTPLDLLYDYYYIDKYVCNYGCNSCRVIDVYYDADNDCYWCTLIQTNLSRHSFSFESVAELFEILEIGDTFTLDTIGVLMNSKTIL